ncbi:Hypothetical predicted protein, partial [Marmota monax]
MFLRVGIPRFWAPKLPGRLGMLGLERFHSVGIMGFNSAEWAIASIGAIMAGKPSLPPSPQDSPHTEPSLHQSRTLGESLKDRPRLGPSLSPTFRVHHGGWGTGDSQEPSSSPEHSPAGLQLLDSASRGFSVGILSTTSPKACQVIAENTDMDIFVVDNDRQLQK